MRLMNNQLWRKTLLAALLYGGVVGVAGAVVTNFSQDVNTSINNGLTWLANQGAFANPSSAGDATGLTTLALLEKRQDADLNSATQGYSRADATDQARMRVSVASILSHLDDYGAGAPPSGFYAYKDGGDMMALSAYLRTGGPDRGAHLDLPAALPYDLIGAINRMVDRAKAVQDQNELGYWCYTNGGCEDSSTTQLVVSGLLAAKGVYNDPRYSDPARLATIDGMLAKIRAAYASIPVDSCSVLTPTERGHGYNRGHCASLQQTASGVWIQLAGGADVNDAGVQAYLEWLRNRYGYSNGNGNANGGWDLSSYYYFWTFFKGLQFIQDSGIPSTGIKVEDLGMLPSGDAPVFAPRQLHLDPATVARPALFGAEGAGYYASMDEPPRMYFDLAHTLLAQQSADGRFAGFGQWDQYSDQAFSILLLTRSVGAGCVDSNNDGVCDSETQCPVDQGEPVIDALSVTPNMAQNNMTPVALSARFHDDDEDGLDTEVVKVDWGDGSGAQPVEHPGDGSVAASHVYTAVGEYMVTLTVEDKCRHIATKTYQSVVVFDPNVGFMTGAGSTQSAAFSFSAWYRQQGNNYIPTGRTSFTFIDNRRPMAFVSTSYDWFFVTNNGGTKTAQLKGSGRLNGAGNYGFQLIVRDGTPDTVQMKIWNKADNRVVYEDLAPQPVRFGVGITIR